MLAALTSSAFSSDKKPSVLISTQELKKYSAADLLIIDIRDYKDYLEQHIDHAIHIDVEDTFNKSGDPSRLAQLDHVQDFLSKAGVKNDDYIVIYDNSDLKNAAHLFWLLETYNHKRLSVLDGGFPGWLRTGGKISTSPHARLRSKYLASISTRHFATKLTTRLAVGSQQATIIDSRSKQEYRGLESKAKRFGHIPNAISIPWSDNYISSDAKGLLRGKNKLESLYKDLDKEKPVITYCNRGKQSAVSYLIMRHLGFNVSVYDGGWLEWGNDTQLPIKNHTVKSHADGTL